MSTEPLAKPSGKPILLWAGEVTRLGLNFVVLALLARSITAAVLGTYLSLTAVVLIAPRLLDCGLPHAFGYFLRVEPTSLRSCVGVLILHLAMVSPLAIAVAYAVRFVPFGDGGAMHVAAEHWLQLALLILSELAILLGQGAFIPTSQFKAYLFTTVSPPLLFLMCIVVWPRAHLSPGMLLDLLLATSLVGCAIMATMLVHAARGFRGAHFARALAYGYGMRSYGAAVSKVAAQRFDRLFLVTVLGAAGYAQYSLAISIRDMAVLPANLYAMTLRNRQIDLIAHERNLAGARVTLLQVSSFWFALGLGGAVVMYPLWASLVQLGFGEKFHETAHFLQIVGFSCAPLAITGFAWNHLYAMQLPGRVTVLTSLSILLALPLFAFFIRLQGPSLGVASAVVAWSMIAAGTSLAWALVGSPKSGAAIPA